MRIYCGESTGFWVCFYISEDNILAGEEEEWWSLGVGACVGWLGALSDRERAAWVVSTEKVSYAMERRLQFSLHRSVRRKFALGVCLA